MVVAAVQWQTSPKQKQKKNPGPILRTPLLNRSSFFIRGPPPPLKKSIQTHPLNLEAPGERGGRGAVPRMGRARDYLLLRIPHISCRWPTPSLTPTYSPILSYFFLWFIFSASSLSTSTPSQLQHPESSIPGGCSRVGLVARKDESFWSVGCYPVDDGPTQLLFIYGNVPNSVVVVVFFLSYTRSFLLLLVLVVVRSFLFLYI